MLKTKNYIKGKQILTVKDLIDAPSTIFVRLKNISFGDFEIDNPVNNIFSSIGEDDLIQKWMENTLKNYDAWERIEKNRTPVFSEEIDAILDSLISEFAYDYTELEYHQEELMEKFLKQLKDKFRIEVRDDE